MTISGYLMDWFLINDNYVYVDLHMLQLNTSLFLNVQFFLSSRWRRSTLSASIRIRTQCRASIMSVRTTSQPTADMHTCWKLASDLGSSSCLSLSANTTTGVSSWTVPFVWYFVMRREACLELIMTHREQSYQSSLSFSTLPNQLICSWKLVR